MKGSRKWKVFDMTTTLSDLHRSFLARHLRLAPIAAVRVSPLGTVIFGTYMNERYGVCNKEESLEIFDTFYEQRGLIEFLLSSFSTLIHFKVCKADMTSHTRDSYGVTKDKPYSRLLLPCTVLYQHN